jgi:hypothetical protein
MVRAVISKHGLVEDVRFLKKPPGLCSESRVRRTLESWRFTPAQLHGEPVAVYYYMTINIGLQ